MKIFVIFFILLLFIPTYSQSRIYQCIKESNGVVFSNDMEPKCTEFTEYSSINLPENVGEETVTFDCNDIEIVELFSSIAHHTGMNIVWESNVEGRISLKLNAVALKDVLGLIISKNGFQHIVENMDVFPENIGCSGIVLRISSNK